MDERFEDPLGPASPGPVHHENAVFVESGSDLGEPKPSIRDRAVDAKARLEANYAKFAETAKLKSREGVTRARNEFETRLRTHPMQIVAASAALGFLAGMLVRMSTGRISKSQREQKARLHMDD